MPTYYYFQGDMHAAIDQAWTRGAKNVLGVLATGGGKTVIKAGVARAVNEPTIAIAHRGELVTQISKAFAREGLRHRIIGPPQLRRACTAEHVDDLGVDWIDPGARMAIASVDTLINYTDPWLDSVRLWLTDEGHHVLKVNKWGQCLARMPKAKGLGVTATGRRPDGHGLGAHTDGVYHEIVEGPPMRQLINEGFLCDYRAFAPPSDIDYSQVGISATTGDLNQTKLREVVHKSATIVGDVVQHYLRIAPGKRGITFAVDVAAAVELAAAYRLAGVTAEVVSAKTPDAARRSVIRDFRQGRLLQLVNVDLFGEGFDVPACEVVSMVRKTESFIVYAQQFGRALRTMAGKPYGIIIDHVGNIHRHGLPDVHRPATLERQDKRSRGLAPDVIPTRTCTNEFCLSVYERCYLACPYCGTWPTIADRSSPAFVDGDLYEISPETLAAMRAEIMRIDGPPIVSSRGDPIVGQAIINTHWVRQQAQAALRSAVAQWAGCNQTSWRDGDREGHKRFYFKFGVDVMTAMTLNAADATKLTEKIIASYSR